VSDIDVDNNDFVSFEELTAVYPEIHAGQLRGNGRKRRQPSQFTRDVQPDVAKYPGAS
jgi:hypothetical protein